MDAVTTLREVGVRSTIRSMLRKSRLDDGGIDVETRLIGPAVFLDLWAVRDFSRERSSELRDRFAPALKARSGSLLVSSAWVTELDTIKGDARTRAQALFYVAR